MKPKTFRERSIFVIKEIADLMNQPNKETCYPLPDVESMWDIISALRGPDFSVSFDIKDLTTSRIRAAIGMENRGYVNVVNEPLTEYDELPDNIDVRGHFGQHYGRACQALVSLGFIKGPISSPTER